MKLIALFLLVLVSAAITVSASDPFGWVFGCGLFGVGAGLVIGWAAIVRRLIRSRGAFGRALGYLLATATGVALLVIAVGWGDYRRIAFRRADAGAWAADIKTLLTDVERLPPGLAATARRTMAPELIGLERDLDALNDDQRQARLTRAIASLRDGHSMAFPYFPSTSFSLVPLQLRWFSDGLFITAAPASRRQLVGQRVVRIAGLPVEEALNAVRPYVAADNDTAIRTRSTYYMLSPRFWSAIGHPTDPDRLQFGLQSSGQEHIAELSTVSRWRYLWWVFEPRRWIRPPRLSPNAAPSFEWRRDNFWITPMPERGAVYVALRAVQPNGKETLTAFATRILTTARSSGAQRIVIDVRENGGGDNTLFRGMIKALRESEFNVKGRLMLLIGGGTFSAATNFVSAMERDTAVTLVGEPTGSGPNHFGDSQPTRLPRTGIMVFLSTRYHQFGAADDDRVAHDPEVTVTTSAADYFAGRDPVLEAALGYQPSRGR